MSCCRVELSWVERGEGDHSSKYNVRSDTYWVHVTLIARWWVLQVFLWSWLGEASHTHTHTHLTYLFRSECVIVVLVVHCLVSCLVCSDLALSFDPMTDRADVLSVWRAGWERTSWNTSDYSASPKLVSHEGRLASADFLIELNREQGQKSQRLYWSLIQ